MTTPAFNTVADASNLESALRVAVELEWAGGSSVLRHLRLPDGSLFTLSQEQFTDLKQSIKNASYDDCLGFAREARRTFATPAAHGFVEVLRADLGNTLCWVHPSTPQGPAIWCNNYAQVWLLVLPDFGRRALDLPLERAEWGDAAAVAQLCALAADPDSLRVLASLQFPQEMAEAVLVAAGDQQWSAVRLASQMQTSLVTRRMKRREAKDGTVALNLLFRPVGVTRLDLGIAAWHGGPREPIVIGVELYQPHPERQAVEVTFESVTLAWLKDAMAGGRIAVTVVERDGKVYVTRNADLFSDCIDRGLLVDASNLRL